MSQRDGLTGLTSVRQQGEKVDDVRFDISWAKVALRASGFAELGVVAMVRPWIHHNRDSDCCCDTGDSCNDGDTDDEFRRFGAGEVCFEHDCGGPGIRQVSGNYEGSGFYSGLRYERRQLQHKRPDRHDDMAPG